jgi:mRNA interferase RelE/StbE
MGSYSIRTKVSAANEVERIEPRKLRRQIVTRIQTLAANPRPPDCEKPAGAGGRHRVRQGAYRIVHEVRDEEPVVVLLRVGYRSDVYRNP